MSSDHDIDHTQVLANLRDKFYSEDGTCTIFQGKDSGPVDQSPSTRLGRILGVTKFVALVVAPTAAAAAIYALSVAPNLEGPLTTQTLQAAHHATFDSPEALAQVAGARGPHHDEGIPEALEEATRLTPAQVATLANEQGWSGSAIERVMEQHQIHKVGGQFVADPSALHADTPALDQLVEFIQRGASLLDIPQAQFAGLMGHALDQFMLVSASYDPKNPRPDIFGDKLHDSIYVASYKEDRADMAVVEFNIATGEYGVRDVMWFDWRMGGGLMPNPSLNANLVGGDGELQQPFYQGWIADELAATGFGQSLENMAISKRASAVDLPSSEEVAADLGELGR
jgi:hypothetical protein